MSHNAYGDPYCKYKVFTTSKSLGHEIKRQYNLIQDLKKEWEKGKRLSLKEMFSIL